MRLRVCVLLQGQLGDGLTTVLSHKQPGVMPRQGGFSRGDRDWDYGNLSMITEACRNLDAHPEKATARCIRHIWSCVLIPDKLLPPPAAASTQLAVSNKVHELITL